MNFLCNHSICSECFFKKYKEKIQNLKNALESSPNYLNGKSSYLGCVEGCLESALSIPPNWLVEFFELNGEKELSNTIKTCSTFLTGISTYFYKCEECNCVYSSLKENSEHNH